MNFTIKSLLSALVASAFFAQAHAKYTLVDHFDGSSSDFFADFDFFDAQSPTDGFVAYQSYENAVSRELVGLVNSSHSTSHGSSGTAAYIGVDFTSKPSTGRDSVRIQSRQAWTHGLLIADIQAAPSGCGLWPALWLVSHSDTWPGNTGEIDIIEYVNNAAGNQMTLHTSANCAVPNTTDAFSGTMLTSNCDVNAPNQATNAGCGIVAPSNNSTSSPGLNSTHATAGPAFNTNGGGVYAVQWTSSALTFWFWPRASIPSDISSGTPDPSTWTSARGSMPLAKFSGGAGCDLDAHLSGLSLVINTEICGVWAGEVFGSDGCAAQTGASSCNAYAEQNPEAFRQAYWLINGVKVYQEKGDERTVVNEKREVRIAEVPVVGLEGREWAGRREARRFWA